MLEVQEGDTASAILHHVPAMQEMKQAEPERYLRLQHLLQRPVFDSRDVCPFLCIVIFTSSPFSFLNVINRSFSCHKFSFCSSVRQYSKESKTVQNNIF